MRSGFARTRVPHAFCEGEGLQGGWDQSYTRHISAKSGRGHASTLDSGVCSVSPSVALSFQLCANWDDAGLQIAPQSDQELARHSNDRNPTRATFEVANPFPKPAAERALRLIAQPGPGELDHHRARLGITGLADAWSRSSNPLQNGLDARPT